MTTEAGSPIKVTGATVTKTARTSLRWRIERRAQPLNLSLFRFGAVLIGIVLSLFLAPLFTSASSSALYSSMWTGTFGSTVGIENVLTTAIPLLLCGLAASIPYRLQLWNVGIDGQIYMGAWAATGISYHMVSAPGFVIVPVMFAVAMVAGALWILIPTLARIMLGVSEVITTFLLNFVALGWLMYWATGPWYAPSAAGGIFAIAIPGQADIGLLNLNGILVNWGIVVAVALPLIFWAANRYTKWGYEVTIIGASDKAGRYAGMNVRRVMLTTMLMGGALGGLAGAITMMGTNYQLTPGVTNNTGFNGLIIAVLAGANEIGVLVLGLIYAVLLAAGDAIQVVGGSADMVFAVIGVTLIFGTFGEAIARLHLVRTRPPEGAAPTPSTKTMEVEQ
jgi:ABC-type uncharacterized transport system permease subunit